LNRDAYEPQRHDKYLYDYFGPSVDTGFRLFGKSDPRYFPVSVEVALAMIGRSKVPGSTQKEFHVDDLVLLEFLGLKGVWGGKRYPVIAIDVHYENEVNKAYSKFENRNNTADIEDLCLACYTSIDWPSQLYLPESPDDRFRLEPEIPSEPADISPVGVEEQASDIPNPAELSDNPPLGETKYNTGFQQLRLDTGLTSAAAEAALRTAIEADLGPDEFLSRFEQQSPVPSSEEGKTIFSAHWWATKNVGPKGSR